MIIPALYMYRVVAVERLPDGRQGALATLLAGINEEPLTLPVDEGQVENVLSLLKSQRLVTPVMSVVDER